MPLLLVNKIIIKMTSQTQIQLHKNEIMNMEPIFSRQFLFAMKKTFEKLLLNIIILWMYVCVCVYIIFSTHNKKKQ